MAAGTKVIAAHSFLVELDDLGECSFVSALAPNERELVFFVFRAGKIHQGLVTHEKVKAWRRGTVSAVTFRDVDGDGSKDVVIVAEYATGTQKTPAAIVYMRRGANFKLDEARSERACNRSGVVSGAGSRRVSDRLHSIRVFPLSMSREFGQFSARGAGLA
jgi:hypothetical protein